MPTLVDGRAEPLHPSRLCFYVGVESTYLLIERMPTLVHSRAEALGPVVGEASGDANVRGSGATGEGVGGDIEASVGEDCARQK
jgi:hypothetical protein